MTLECVAFPPSRKATADTSCDGYSEIQDLTTLRGLPALPAVAYYGVGVIVNSANPIKNLRAKQVRDLFTGATSNWKDLGGPDLAVRVLIPERTAGTYLRFQELAMERKPYREDAGEVPTYLAIQLPGSCVFSPGRHRNRAM
ncbi:MAG: substrate-binding domain-containing protein [bacterium]